MTADDPSSPSPNFTDKQKEAQALLTLQRHTLLVGGSRSGKTTLLVHAIGKRAIRAPRSRHAILRFHANAARVSITLDTLPKVFEAWFPDHELKPHRTEEYFSLENDSEIWVGGLDDRNRVEKILGREYATIFLNECSQIPYSSVQVALTRLARVIPGLPQAAYYDLNPVAKGHWTNLLFGEKRDPVSRTLLPNPGHYARMFLNPRDNAANLTPEYLESLAALPERARKQFYEGVYVDEVDGSLFSYEVIAQARVDTFPLARCRRIVVAVDPSGASSADDNGSDEIGVIVAAKGDDDHAYILADRSLRDAPAVWGRAVVQASAEYDADVIIAEENFGGEMVRFVIRAADPNANVRVISASRGKVLRAEPVSALYEQGLVHHVGRFTTLEDQLCAFTTQGYRGEGSPDHADALVFAVTELMLKETSSILEFYRRQATGHIPPAPARRDHVLAVAAPTHLRLRAPTDISAVHGPTGAFYLCDAEHCIQANREDVDALSRLGFVPAPPAARPPPIFSSLLTRKRRPLLASTHLTQMMCWISLHGGGDRLVTVNELWSLDGKLWLIALSELAELVRN